MLIVLQRTKGHSQQHWACRCNVVTESFLATLVDVTQQTVTVESARAALTKHQTAWLKQQMFASHGSGSWKGKIKVTDPACRLPPSCCVLT